MPADVSRQRLIRETSSGGFRQQRRARQLGENGAVERRRGPRRQPVDHQEKLADCSDLGNEKAALSDCVLSV